MTLPSVEDSIFSKEGLGCLARCAQARCLVAFDFDGTLAPIVNRPDDAKMSSHATHLLDKLSTLYPVCVISGRSKKDVRTRIPKSVTFLVGNHGAEGPQEIFDRDVIEELRQRVAVWKNVLELELQNDTGVWIEDKSYSLSIHYRDAPSTAESERRIFEVAHLLTPPARLVPGKCVVNVTPPELPHKGTALLNLMNQTASDTALFVGDDHTDEDVFALESDHILTIRVGHSSHSKAFYFLNTQEEMIDLMQILIALRSDDLSKSLAESH